MRKVTSNLWHSYGTTHCCKTRAEKLQCLLPTGSIRCLQAVLAFTHAFDFVFNHVDRPLPLFCRCATLDQLVFCVATHLILGSESTLLWQQCSHCECRHPCLCSSYYNVVVLDNEKNPVLKARKSMRCAPTRTPFIVWLSCMLSCRRRCWHEKTLIPLLIRASYLLSQYALQQVLVPFPGAVAGSFGAAAVLSPLFFNATLMLFQPSA